MYIILKFLFYKGMILLLINSKVGKAAKRKSRYIWILQKRVGSQNRLRNTCLKE